MLRFLKGGFAAVALTVNVLVIFTLMLPLALVKLLLPLAAVRTVADRVLNGLATRWVRINSAWMTAVGRTEWDVRGVDGLRPDGWYLLSSNHQSWVDILVLQHVFHGHVPFLKFFLKRELIWVPVIGLAWWALDFPFMRRRGSSGTADLERARRACEKFRRVPTTVINFLEGTRYSAGKHATQRSPFRHLLKPKIGGIATAIATLGDRAQTLLDVTIAYPDGPPTFWQLLSGQVRRVVVHVNAVPIPAEFIGGDYAGDAAFRARIQDWVYALWRDKDRLLDGVLAAPLRAA